MKFRRFDSIVSELQKKDFKILSLFGHPEAYHEYINKYHEYELKV